MALRPEPSDIGCEKLSCESCRKYELAITELQLGMPVLSALFHKEQGKLDLKYLIPLMFKNLSKIYQDKMRKNVLILN